jgi:hypothetical protein
LFNDELDPELLQRSSATFIARDNTTIMSVDGKTFLNELNKMGISSEEWRTETVAVPAKAPEIAPTKNVSWGRMCRETVMVGMVRKG